MIRPRKYRNKPVTVDGLSFDSKAEAARYGDLKLLQRAGEITDLATQVPFELAPGCLLSFRKNRSPALRYNADFTYRRHGILVVEDVKGKTAPLTEAFIVKAHLMKALLGLDVEIYRA